jgi:hypothetical protein
MSFIDDVFDIPGNIINTFTGSKKSSGMVNPNGIPLGGPIQDPNQIIKAIYDSNNTNTNIIQPKTLKHGGEVEITKGHNYIKDLL